MRAFRNNVAFVSFMMMFVGMIAFAQEDEEGALAPIQCPAGQEAETWGLRKLGSEIPKDVLRRIFPDSEGGEQVSDAANIRLEMCVDSEDRVSLKRIVQVMLRYGSTLVFDESNAEFLVVEGLTEARMLDYAKLRIIVKSREGDSGTVILGSNDQPTPHIAYSEARVYSATRWKSNSLRPWVGWLDSYDPFAYNPCDDGKSPVKSVFKFATVAIEYELCMFPGGGETSGYDLMALKITDHEANRPAITRGVPIVFERSELLRDNASTPTDSFTEEQKNKRFVLYRWGHHNACDSIYIQVPELKAAYALTSAPSAGCGESVMGGVVREVSDQQGARFAKIRIDYDGQSGRPFFAESMHYFRFF